MNETPHAIILTGFMGTGKSTVGQQLAAALGRPFVDLDEAIEALAGRPIPALFEEGEAHFRWWEQQALRRLDWSRPLVLATGGGTLIGAWNQRFLAAWPIIVLDASLATVRARLGDGAGRPLAAQLAEWHARRAAIYARLPHHIDTEGRPPEAIVAEIVARLPDWSPTAAPAGGQSLTVRVPGGGQYPIHVAPGVAAGIGGFLQAWEPGAVALITDSTVGSLWGETVRHDLLAARLPTTLIQLPAGEAHKTLDTVATIYDQLLAAGIDRGGAIVALGGGVVGDMAGFVAATWMRGVRTLVQVPTTVLAMVDASVGGKTGVDHPRGKNLIGAFRQPDLVLADPAFLTTLPARERRSGLAELLKHALLADPPLWEMAEAQGAALVSSIADAPELLARAIRVKVALVERDPFEQGERALLNLGHTFGHAYELLSGFELAHGEAISVGLVTAARLSEAEGLAPTGLAARIERLLATMGLPTRWPPAADGALVWETMQSDKKKAARGLRFVLPRAIGSALVTAPGEVERASVLRVLAAQHG